MAVVRLTPKCPRASWYSCNIVGTSAAGTTSLPLKVKNCPMPFSMTEKSACTPRASLQYLPNFRSRSCALRSYTRNSGIAVDSTTAASTECKTLGSYVIATSALPISTGDRSANGQAHRFASRAHYRPHPSHANTRDGSPMSSCCYPHVQVTAASRAACYNP